MIKSAFELLAQPPLTIYACASVLPADPVVPFNFRARSALLSA